jgi:hypothetical protein
MRVHLPRLELNPYIDIPVSELEELAAADRVGRHELTDDPEQSDLILFSQCHMLWTDWRLSTLRAHPLARRYREKVLVYDERDRPWRGFPGIYVSMPKGGFDPRYQRAWGYFRVPSLIRTRVEPDLLFSFVGSPSHGCRRPLFELQHPDGIVDEVHSFTFWDDRSPDFEARKARYRETLSRTRFVLCPRGRGTSSFRLYETLAAGRVPVIIADDWVPPEGPDWDRFVIRWPEGRRTGLIEMLEERDVDWPELSAAATAAYGEFFAPSVGFDRLVEQCRDLCESGGLDRFPKRNLMNRAYFSSGADAARYRITSSARSLARRLLRRGRVVVEQP